MRRFDTHTVSSRLLYHYSPNTSNPDPQKRDPVPGDPYPAMPPPTRVNSFPLDGLDSGKLSVYMWLRAKST